MWGIIPAAGLGSRIQPLAFSKELLPVGSERHRGIERPRAVSDYLVERMALAGVSRICFVISPGKSDILEYYGDRAYSASICYTVQPSPQGLCDAIFRAAPFINPEERVIVGLPDTIWFPENALCALPDAPLAFLLFPVDDPERFDAVIADEEGRVLEIQVKHPRPETRWIWGAISLSGQVMRDLHALWIERSRRDEFVGTLVNAYIERGGQARAVNAGESYLDVGTIGGYRHAMRTFGEEIRQVSPNMRARAGTG